VGSYSWATAPRYGDDDRVMQLGPLPELLIAGDPLAADLVAVHGTSAFVRQLVRWTRAAANLRLMRQWLDELESCLGQPTLQPPQPADIDPDAQGFGHANATRGTLMHWVKLSQGKIATYQVITPRPGTQAHATPTPCPAISNKAWSDSPPVKPAAASAHSSWAATTPASYAPPSKGNRAASLKPRQIGAEVRS
jgi:hypothetical protein